MASRHKSCFNISEHHEILGNLNMTCDNTNFSIVLWSKYQVMIFKEENFTRPIIMEPAIPLDKVLIHNNNLVCLDCNGTISVSSICESSPQGRFSEWRQNIIACEFIYGQSMICLKFKEEKYTLFISNINESFDIKGAIELRVPDGAWKKPEQGCGLIVSESIQPELLKQLKNVFDLKNPDCKHYLVVISLDKINIYVCLIPEIQNESLRIKKLYKSHTEIIDVKIVLMDEVYILIGLSSGNFVRVRFTDSISDQKPEIFHLNTALYKFILIESSILYTDGLTMWKTENLFSKSDPVFKQFFVKNVKDFCIVGQQIVCITFSNLVYIFNIESKESYLTPPSNDSSKWSIKSVTDLACFKDTKKTIKENEEISKQIGKESEYLMAAALSSRQDIMDSVIQVAVTVFDDYNALIKHNTGLTLTDNLNEYYDSHSYYFLIKISVALIQHKLNKLLSNLLGDIKIHITLFENKVLKTTSVQIKEQLKKESLVIALKESEMTNMSGIQLQVKIVTNIPAKLNETQRQWITLYKKCIVLSAEHFIKTRSVTKRTCLKDDEMPLEALIYKRAQFLYGTHYSFSLSNEQIHQWSLQIKLPHNYMQILSNKLYYKDHLDTRISDIFLKQKLLLESDKGIQVKIGKEVVYLTIQSEDLTLSPLMLVSCSNIYCTADIRRLISKIIFSGLRDCVTPKELVNHKLYTDVENLQIELRSCMQQNATNEYILELFEKFNTLVYSTLYV